MKRGRAFPGEEDLDNAGSDALEQPEYEEADVGAPDEPDDEEENDQLEFDVCMRTTVMTRSRKGNGHVPESTERLQEVQENPDSGQRLDEKHQAREEIRSSSAGQTRSTFGGTTTIFQGKGPAEKGT